ncbi:MAG: hypothetical protein F6K24_39725, partial [Okeania sp. SIO2D1]|nr:hypothetical protein [Okeania sp. SIO2D1]
MPKIARHNGRNPCRSMTSSIGEVADSQEKGRHLKHLQNTSTKYQQALLILPNHPHSSTLELYHHIKRMGYRWDISKKRW